MTYPTRTYLFKNTETGEIKRAVDVAVNPAARQLGIMVERELLAPWVKYQCWERNELIWQY